MGCGDGRRDVVEAVEADVFRHGERLFQRYCQHCHQPHGRGMPGTFPPLASSEWLHGPVEKPIAIVLLGLQGPIVREGVAFNGVMPGLAARMSDAEIAAILSHVRKRWSDIEEPVDAQTVARVRNLLGDRRSMWTEAELLRAYEDNAFNASSR